jgi:hypothetical protein
VRQTVRGDIDRNKHSFSKDCKFEWISWETNGHWKKVARCSGWEENKLNIYKTDKNISNTCHTKLLWSTLQ